MIHREIAHQCIKFTKQYPVLTITGPRQAGKTTLAKHLFPKKKYVNLEAPDIRRLAIEDPRSFLQQFPDGAILDEIQRVPELCSYIQTIVDDKNKKGMFILTGSQQFEISQNISQSLAGRTAIIKLLPLSMKELFLYKKKKNIDFVLLHGFYPRLHNEKLNPYHFYSNYFETYIERDLQQLSQIDNLIIFEKFVHLLAGHIGGLLNYNTLANDLGVSQPTIKKWISILQASYIVFLLPPYYKNIGKRLIKTPKLYFYDTGLVCYLLGIENIKELKTHPLRGLCFENLVIIEFLKNRFNQGKTSNLYFYRDRTGNEVDLILEHSATLLPVEIKSSQTIRSDFKHGINHFKALFKKEAEEGAIIYAGEQKQKNLNINYIPWDQINF